MSNRPKLHKGRFRGTDSNGNDRYAADYYSKHEVDEYIKELEAKNESLVANYSKSDIELEEENFALKATIARIDTVVARMINEEVWTDDGHRIAEIIRGDKQALENDDE